MWTILVSLQDKVADKVLICHGVDQFNKHMDLNETIYVWKKKCISENMETLKKEFHESSNKEP